MAYLCICMAYLCICMETKITITGNIYNNISFSELGLLLGVGKGQAESTAARMVLVSCRIEFFTGSFTVTLWIF